MTRTHHAWPHQRHGDDLRRDVGALYPEWCQMIAGYLTGLVQATGSENVTAKVVERDFVKGNAAFRLSWTEPPREDHC